LQYASSPVKTTQREETGITGLMRRLNEMVIDFKDPRTSEARSRTSS
jgi:hypothetical protein